MKWNSANINYQNTYQQNNSFTIKRRTAVVRRNIRSLENWNLMNENT